MVSCTSQRISVYLIYYKTEEIPCFFIRGTKFTIFTKPIIRAPCLLPQIFHNNCLQFLLGITVVPSKIDDNRKGSGGGGGTSCIMVCQVPPQCLSRPSRSMLFGDVSETYGRQKHKSLGPRDLKKHLTRTLVKG